MNINSQSKNRFIIAATIILVGLGSLLAYSLTKNPKETTAKDASSQGATSTPSDDEIKAIDATKKADYIDNQNNTPETPLEDNESKVVISSQQESGGSVTIFSRLYGIQSGNCTVRITNGGNQTSQSAEVMYQPEYSTCSGFSIEKGSLGAGKWTIYLEVTSQNSTYSAETTLDVT